jgi:hypothetical protein
VIYLEDFAEIDRGEGGTMPQPIPDVSRDQTRRRILIDFPPPCSNRNSMPTSLRNAVAAVSLLCSLPLASAQEKGYWRAASKTAQSVTGDVTLSDEKITINFVSFTMVRVRALEKADLSALFDADPATRGTGSLYRMDIPASRKFLHKNSLCGDESTEWMATYMTGRSLKIAFFSGQTPPVFTIDAIANSTDMCGSYAYAI